MCTENEFVRWYNNFIGQSISAKKTSRRRVLICQAGIANPFANINLFHEQTDVRGFIWYLRQSQFVKFDAIGHVNINENFSIVIQVCPLLTERLK